MGFVDAIAEPTFTILGVTIETNASTVFRDVNDVVISSDEFFNRLATTDLIEADLALLSQDGSRILLLDQYHYKGNSPLSILSVESLKE